MAVSGFTKLDPKEQALVAVAVLLDGNDAPAYLSLDESRGTQLERAARELAQLELDVRMPYVGTMLRLAVAQIEDCG